MRQKLSSMVLGLAIAVVPFGAAADCGKDHAQAAAKQAGSPCAMAMQQREQMQQMRQDMDTRLAQLVERMNAAKGESKVDAMAAVITELTQQRSACQTNMMKMQQTDQKHMMHHMEHAKMMDGCPMARAAAAAGDEDTDGEHTH